MKCHHLNLLQHSAGETAVQYALAVALLAVAAITAFMGVGCQLTLLLNEVGAYTSVGENDLGFNLGCKGLQIETGADMSLLASQMAADGDSVAATDILAAKAALSQGDVFTAMQDSKSAYASFGAQELAESQQELAQGQSDLAHGVATGNQALEAQGELEVLAAGDMHQVWYWGSLNASSGLSQLIAGGGDNDTEWTTSSAAGATAYLDDASFDAAGGPSAIANPTVAAALTALNAEAISAYNESVASPSANLEPWVFQLSTGFSNGIGVPNITTGAATLGQIS